MLAPVLQPSLSVRPLTAFDAPLYRALRHRILNSDDARYFSDSYEREGQLTERQWLEWCTEEPEHCILGTFANSELVAIIMITRQGGLDSPVVEWEAVWLDPRYRGKGIGKLSYEKARQWTQAQGYRYAVVFVRDDNLPGLGISKDQGFTYAYTIQNELWADGSIADTHAFLLDLRKPDLNISQQHALETLEEALLFLNQGPHAPPQNAAYEQPMKKAG